jgi:hypothetical protein
VAGGGEDRPDLVAYLTRPEPVTDEVLALAAPFPPTTVFRFAAPCAESACVHFDGTDCRLAGRIVEHLSVAVDLLPACAVRSRCRWWQQEGRAACLRCPAVATNPLAAGDDLRKAAQPAP